MLLSKVVVLRESGLSNLCIFSHSEETKFISIIQEACEEALTSGQMTRKKNSPRQQSIWWSKELEDTRKKLQRWKRARQRANKKGKWYEAEALDFMYGKEKKLMIRLIAESKKRKWQELCEMVNKDVWGKPYKAVMKSLRNSTPPATLSPEFAFTVLTELFPQETPETEIEEEESESSQLNLETEDGREEESSQQPWIVNNEEIIKAAKNIKGGKAAGLDGSPPEIIKEIASSFSENIAALFSGIFKRGNIPHEWKQARLILLKKPGKDAKNPSAFRPICIINGIAKLMEYVLKNRILSRLGGKPFESNQFGFAKGKATVNAMEHIKNEMADSKKRRRFAAVIALDVKNAFNSLKWKSIYKELVDRDIPRYLIKVIKNYFQDRNIEYQTGEKVISIKMQRGVPQGSVLGPLMWNLVYDGLLKKDLPKNSKMVAFADDVILMSSSLKLDNVKRDLELSVEKVDRWMSGVGLELAAHKTEAMFLNNKRIKENFVFKIGEAEIVPKEDIKYLGVTFSKAKKFHEHIVKTSNKAVKTMCSLSRLMGNKMDINTGARKLLYSVMESIMLYGAPIWAEAISLVKNARLIRRTQRLGLARVISSYRSVSFDAMTVLAGIPPWNLKIKERVNISSLEKYLLDENILPEEISCIEERLTAEGIEFPNREDFRDLDTDEPENEERKKKIKKKIRNIAKEETIKNWQKKWDTPGSGRWTHTLIPNIKIWLERKHGTLNFYLTQVLTGHGVFNVFRKRLGKTVDDSCWFHQGIPDTPEHTILDCDMWNLQRTKLCSKLRINEESLNFNNIMREIAESEEKWKAFSGFCKDVMKAKEVMEIQREKEEIDNPIREDLEADLESADFRRIIDI